MISREIYHRWMVRYATRVGLNADGGLEMLAAWYEDFLAMNLTLEELDKAGEMAIRRITEAPPRMREHHRSILFAAVKSVRNDGVRKTKELCRANGETDKPADYAEFRRELEKRNWHVGTRTRTKT